MTGKAAMDHPRVSLNQRLAALLQVVLLHPGGREAARLLLHLRYFVLGASTLLLAVATFVWPSLHPFLMRMANLDLVVFLVTVGVSLVSARGSARLLRIVLLAAFLSDLGLEIIGLVASGFSNSSFIVVPILTLLSAAVLIGERPAAVCALCFGLGYPAATLMVFLGWWPLPSDLSWVGDRAHSWSQLLLAVVSQDVFIGMVVAPCLWLVGRLREAYRDYHGRHESAVHRIAVEVRKRREERSAAQLVLRQRERSYQLLADNVSDMVTLCTPALELTFVSPSAARVLGYAPEELLGRSLGELIHPEDLPETTRLLAEHHRAADEDAELLCEFRARHRDGRWIWLETRGRTLSPAAESLGEMVLSSRDVTQRRAFEATMLQTQKLESLGLLAGGVAHDFNNILTSIIGNAELAKRWLSPSSSVWAPVGKISRAAARAAELCKQMMSYAGAGTATLAPVDLNQVIQDIPALLGAAIPPGAVLTYDLYDTLPQVQADAAQLRQVAMNLVMNAAEALEDRPGRVTVASGVTTLGEESPDPPDRYRAQPLVPAAGVEYAYIRVTDTGCGMDRATLERMFDPFFSTKFSGRGLGLSSLLGIVRAHRGFVTVTSQPAAGTEFTVGFPASALPEAAAVDASRVPEWRGAGRVLVVDDEDDILEFVEQALALMGFEVLTASDGSSGLELFRRHAADIVFVMCDVAMPRMSGEAFVRAIRALRADVPVALMTGFCRADVEQSLVDCPADEVVQKPFTLDVLRATAQALLAARA